MVCHHGKSGGSSGFGALLVEIRPEISDGKDPGTLYRLAPQLPWIFAFVLLFAESFIYFPKF